MEANAPEKLYVDVHDNLSDSILYGFTEKRKDDDIEYTRTDAFIEKALKFLDGCIPNYIELKHANVDTFMDVDNEGFIKDFINYMKGK